MSSKAKLFLIIMVRECFPFPRTFSLGYMSKRFKSFFLETGMQVFLLEIDRNRMSSEAKLFTLKNTGDLKMEFDKAKNDRHRETSSFPRKSFRA